MNAFLLLMHSDTTSAPRAEAWNTYLASLRDRDVFDGGSAIGPGGAFRKDAAPGAISGHLSGYIRVRAIDLAGAQALLVGNPVFETGGTVEIRELPRD